jgi:hypothetical protein
MTRIFCDTGHWRSAKLTSWRIPTAISAPLFWKVPSWRPASICRATMAPTMVPKKSRNNFLFMNNLENKFNCTLITPQLTCLKICAWSKP